MPQLTFPMDFWGGCNYRDQADSLVSRSHAQVEGGWRQFPGVGVESPDMLNVDYDPQGLKKRLGQASYSDLEDNLVASEVVRGGFEFITVTGSRVEFAVGKKSLYTDQSGTWAQLKDSASAAYTHDSDATKWTVTFGDGHWFLGTDGTNNEMQTWRAGADLDPEMKNGNTYEDAYGSGTNVMTGTWPTAAYLVAFIHNRLAFSDGQVLLEYTPMAHTASSGIWDLTGSTAGSYHAAGQIRLLTTFIPYGANSATDGILYIGTSAGFESTTGFLFPTDHLNEEKGAKPPLNYQSYCQTLNWIVYLTDDKNIMGINHSGVINLGARFKASDGTGPLDQMSVSDSETNSFGFYDGTKQQAQLWYTTSSARVNDSVAVLDFKAGEPVPGEPQDSFERRVKCLPWQIVSPDDNDWIVGVYQKQGSVIGVKSDGTLWTMESGRNDLGTLAIDARWKSPIFNGGAPFVTLQKQWGRLNLRTIPAGDWDLTVNQYKDRELGATKTVTMLQMQEGSAVVGSAVVGSSRVSSAGVVRWFDRIDRRAENYQFEISNANDSEDFVLANANLTYEIGAEVVN